jgi:hypothetical protein
MKKEYSKPVAAIYTGAPLLVPAPAEAAGAAAGVKAVNAMFEDNIAAHPSRKLEPVY